MINGEKRAENVHIPPLSAFVEVAFLQDHRSHMKAPMKEKIYKSQRGNINVVSKWSWLKQRASDHDNNDVADEDIRL